MPDQGRLKAGSTCSKNTGAATVNKAPNAIGIGAKREMNTVKFWLEPALCLMVSMEKMEYTLLRKQVARAGNFSFKIDIETD